MLGVGERAQIHADFGNDGPGRFAVDSRYCQQAPHGLFEFRHSPLDLLLQGLYLRFKELDLSQFLSQQPALLQREGPFQGQRQFPFLGLQFAFSAIRHPARIPLPFHQILQHLTAGYAE